MVVEVLAIGQGGGFLDGQLAAVEVPELCG